MILTEQHRQFQEKLRDFAQNEVAPVAKELDKQAKFSWDLFHRMGELNSIHSLMLLLWRR